MLNFKRIAIAAVLSVAALTGSYQVGKAIGSANEKATQQEVLKNDYIKKSEAATKEHNAVQTALDAIGKKHSDQMAELEGSSDGIIAGLNADNKRLRVKLKGTTGATSGSGQCVPTVDGKAELDDSTAKRLVGITVQGDQWIENLQATVKVLQDRLAAKEAR